MCSNCKGCGDKDNKLVSCREHQNIFRESKSLAFGARESFEVLFEVNDLLKYTKLLQDNCL